MSYKVEALPNSYAELGEGPHWDIETQSLYYIDIVNAKLFRYDYNEDKVYSCKIENEEVVGFVVPIENAKNKFVVGVQRRIAIVDWDGLAETCKVEKVLVEVEQDDEKFNGNRFNDGKCDPRGRLFAGTMRYHGTDHFEFRYGTFYRYSNGTITPLKGNIGISNGLTWNEKTNKFYYIDTTDFEVKEYDYDFNTGEYKNEKVLIDLRAYEGKKLLPDGMTIDSEGFLYVATFNGSAIYKINPNTGKIELEIKLPCEQITSVAFGGPNLDILYVTSAAVFDKPAPAGTTYKITGLGARGLPMTKAVL